jgi:glycine oxidase
VIVVGAGVIGLSVACELASRGAAVRVLESRGPGLGATQASAGILAPRIEGHSASLLDLGLRSLAGYDAFVARLRAQADTAIEYHRRGTLHVASTQAQAETLAALSGELSDAGASCVLVSGEDARTREPALSPAVIAAVFLPEHGHVGVASLVRALERGLVRCGGEIVLEPARAIRSEGDHLVVATDRLRLEADAVVVAAGPWSAKLEGAGNPPVRPIRGQLLHLRTSAQVVSSVIWGDSAYLVPWQDGSVLVGATVEDVGFDEHATVAGVRGLLDDAVALLPCLRDAAVEGIRVGLRPATADELPLIGPSATMRGVFYATGHYRNGILLAPITASLVADLVVDGTAAPELAAVAPARFGL